MLVLVVGSVMLVVERDVLSGGAALAGHAGVLQVGVACVSCGSCIASILACRQLMHHAVLVVGILANLPVPLQVVAASLETGGITSPCWQFPAPASLYYWRWMPCSSRASTRHASTGWSGEQGLAWILVRLWQQGG